MSSELTECRSRYVTKVGGIVILFYKATRLATLVTLLALSVVTSYRFGWSKVNVLLTEAMVCTAPFIFILLLRGLHIH